ncbi:MAG: hypothetical protein KBT21_05015 [Treponema sp.]|nr:hypothetical protein [Candidatus Treponema merdequi]
MPSLVKEIIQGRKTFFITPDKSLFPETYLEDYLSRGYECYFIDNDIILPIDIKMEILLSVFKDSIVFFNIDTTINNVKWQDVISKCRTKYPEALLGVLYAKKQSPADKLKLEQYYIMDVGVQCGCIQLEWKKENNFSVLEKTLYANEAMGRRKAVRACCNGFCTMKFRDKFDNLTSVTLNDVSLSHFSIFVGTETGIDFEDYEKIENIQFVIRGLHFVSDAIIFTKRDTPEGKLIVFAFSKKDGQLGLDPLNRQLLIPKLYSIMEENFNGLVNKLFQSAKEKLNIR